MNHDDDKLLTACDAISSAHEKGRSPTIAQAGRWVQTAEVDQLTARNMLALGKRSPCPVVSFHSQQCAEKYLKSLLTLHSVNFPRTHALLELLRLVPSGEKFRTVAKDAAFPGRFAVKAR